LQKGGITLYKPEVSRTLLQDMKKYFPELDESEYTLTANYTSDIVLQEFRNLCSIIPVDVTTWARVNPVNTGAFNGPVDDRICFVRDQLNTLLQPLWPNPNEVMVVGSHEARGMLLPIFQIRVPEYRFQMVLANNFQSWDVSVNSEVPLPDDLVERLFDKNENIAPHGFCKFPDGFNFKSFAADPGRFVFSVYSDHYLFTFCFLAKRFLLKQFAV
jgi:hypothetical protein